MITALSIKMIFRIPRFLRRSAETDCTEVRELSSDYIDGELGDRDTGRVRSHLDICPPCRAFVNTLKATVGLLRSSPKRQAPDEFRERLHKAVRKQEGS